MIYIFIGFILLGLILWIFPWLQTRNIRNKLDIKDLCELRNNYRKTIAQIIGGFILLIGLFFTSQNIYLLKEGQITERFTRAVQQLGSDKIEVRIGGIYGLERIANDSVRDHLPVVEIITAFIRTHAPLQNIGKLRPSEDVQAALDVIGRREWQRDAEIMARRKYRVIDLSNTNLEGADLVNAHLEYANFENSNLKNAKLTYAQLQYAILTNSNLERAYFLQANLYNAYLMGAKLDFTCFNNTILNGANFYNTDLSTVQALTEKQFKQVKINDKTVKPRSFWKPLKK